MVETSQSRTNLPLADNKRKRRRIAKVNEGRSKLTLASSSKLEAPQQLRLKRSSSAETTSNRINEKAANESEELA